MTSTTKELSRHRKHQARFWVGRARGRARFWMGRAESWWVIDRDASFIDQDYGPFRSWRAAMDCACAMARTPFWSDADKDEWRRGDHDRMNQDREAS